MNKYKSFKKILKSKTPRTDLMAHLKLVLRKYYIHNVNTDRLFPVLKM